ncbi:hypothetical protein CAEBREN_18113 [Caenorhabditis brenneri]|uniref:Uncharacterized protein n=1 Tax=Caenorhabditis brenneri TaxID=135651 RepID=G0MD08_CAEBE|nr:hypothetical protein CAEBREN_18113 [Caenorhabditis brenneri]
MWQPATWATARRPSTSNLTPGHYTDFPVPGEERFTTSESEGNILIARSILTPEDYESGQRSSLTAASYSALEPMIAKSQISGITDRSSSINCHPIFTEKLAILETTAMMKNGDTSHRHANAADSAVNDPFRSPITRSTKVSVLCQSGKPNQSEPVSTVEAEELATEQINKKVSYLTYLSGSDDGLHDGFAKGLSVFPENFGMRSPSVLTQQKMLVFTDDQSSSTSLSNNVQIHDEMTSSSVIPRKIKAVSKHKATQRLDHQQVRRNRRAEEAAAKISKTKQQDKGNHRRLRGQRAYNKGSELSVEEPAMLPAQEAMKAHARREQAKAARAQSPIFMFDEQRIIMDNFEEEHGQQPDRMDHFEHEDEAAGWMMDGGFGGDVDAGNDVAGNDLLVVDGFGNQEGIEFALMEGDDAFAHSSLALTPPQH